MVDPTATVLFSDARNAAKMISSRSNSCIFKLVSYYFMVDLTLLLWG